MIYFAEMRVFTWKLIAVALSIFLYFPTHCNADISDDLKPIDGYVVKAGENEFIIDLGAQHGIEIGDVFTVTGQGEELIHPITKKVIGKLEKVKGVVKVIRIDQGFSFARPIGQTAAIKRGDSIKRFASLKAVFWDYSDENRPLFDSLQHSLTSLTWQDYNDSQLSRPSKPSPLTNQNDALLFIVGNNTLEVRDAQLGFIRQYPLNGASLSSRGVKIPPIDGSSIAAPKNTVAVSTQPVHEKKKTSIINYGASSTAVGLRENTLMADVLQQSGQRLLAATDGKKISVFKVEDQLKLIAEGKVASFGKILTVKWWQPTTNGPLYLAVLAWTDDKIDSTVFSLQNNRLITVAGGLNSILGTFDLDKDGRPETLFSQEFEAGNFFGRRIKELYWHNSLLKQRKISLVLPPKFTVIGGVLADLTGDGKLEAAYVRNGVLWVYSGKEKLYVSQKQMGGSLSTLTYKVDPTLVDYRTTSVFFEIAPVSVDVDKDGREELLVVSSDQSSFKMPGALTTINTSRIMIFNYEEGSFVKGTVGEPVGAAIQGLAVDSRQIIYVATETGSPLAPGGNSRLQTLEIAL